MIWYIVIWYIVGILVVMYTDNGGLAMISHNFPMLALVMLFLFWTLWPLLLLLYFVAYLRGE